MRARHLSVLGLLAACTQAPQPAAVSVAPTLVFPRDLLGEISSIHLQVFDTAAGVACSTSTASMTGVPTGPSPLPTALAETDLGTSGCTTPNAKFCGTLPLAESKTALVFAAVGKSSTGSVIANGCTSTLVNQEAVTVQISMVRFTPPAVCGNGIVEVGETCDPGTSADPLCKNCQTSEIQLSPASTYAGGPSGPAVGERGNPAFLWPAASGDPGYFFAFFTDHTGSPSRQQVSMSVFSGLLAPVMDLGTAVQGASLFLPGDPMNFPPQPQQDDQSHPSAALVGATYFVVFEDDNTTPPNGIDVHLRSMDASLSANQGPGGACGVNGPMGAGEAGVQSDPHVAAGPGGILFVVWQDESLQTVSGVLYTPLTPPASGCGTVGTQVVIGSGSAPVVAASPMGWLVAWQDGSTVKWTAIGSSGMPAGAGQAVGSQSGQQGLPAIAASSTDGGFAVAWTAPTSTSTSAIFAQRFSATQMPIAGDQTSPVNNLTMGPETSPAIAYTSAAGGSYVVAWVDSGSPNQVRGRLLTESSGSLGDGSGYLFNTIDGQINEFPVSATPGRARANPTVVVGGTGPNIAFGWEDQSAPAGSDQPGIIGRRFPPPTQ
jgi:hypothetical protein